MAHTAKQRWMMSAFAVLGVVLSGCASVTAGALGALEPAFDVAVIRDVPYAPGPRHALDVYAPKRAHDAPVVVFFYGGSWDSGEKSIYPFVGKALAEHGYVVVIPDYRIYPEAGYRDFLSDSAAAVRWAVDHAAAYGGDRGRLFLMGHSAGAYNAAMLALDGQWLEAVGLSAKRDIRGVVGLAGPYDFLPLTSPRLMTIFGPEAERAITQPINHVSAGAPPMFLAHDIGDRVVAVKNTENLARKLQAAGVPVETRYYDNLDHVRIIAAIATPFRFMGPVFADVVGYIDRRAGGSAR